MSSAKSKAGKGPQQKHLHSRISYLYQAATYLAEIGSTEPAFSLGHNERGTNTNKVCEDSVMFEAPCPDRGYALPIIKGILEGDVVASEARSAPTSQSCGGSRQLFAHLRAVSLKGQIRLSPQMKHSICKRCDQFLVPGCSATICMENKSRGAKKPWADVLVIKCIACGTAKRFPVGAKRQLRKGGRSTHADHETEHTAAPT